VYALRCLVNVGFNTVKAAGSSVRTALSADDAAAHRHDTTALFDPDGRVSIPLEGVRQQLLVSDGHRPGGISSAPWACGMTC